MIHPYRSIVRDDIEKRNLYAITHIISLIFGFFILLPIRLFALFFTLFVFRIIGPFLAGGVRKSDIPLYHTKVQDKPYIPAEKAKFIVLCARFFVRIFCFIFGVWISYEGNEHLPKSDDDRPQISIFAPHTTLLDMVALLSDKPRPISCIANHLEAKRKLVSFAYNLLECIPIDPFDAESRRTCVKSIKHRATSPFWKGRQILLQGEGNTHGGRTICQIKQGGFIPGVPVQVTVLEWVEWQDVLIGNITSTRRNQRGSGWFAWSYDDPFWFPYLYLFCCPMQYVRIKALPTYIPDEDEASDPQLFAVQVKEYISKLTSIEVSNCNRFDGELLTYMHKRYPDLNPDDYILQCELLEQEFGTKVLTKQNLFTAFDEAIRTGLRKDGVKTYIKDRLSEIYEEGGFTSSSSHGFR